MGSVPGRSRDPTLHSGGSDWKKRQLHPAQFTVLNKQVTRVIPSLKHTSNLTPFFESSFQRLKLLHKAEIRRKYSKIFRNFLKSLDLGLPWWRSG